MRAKGTRNTTDNILVHMQTLRYTKNNFTETAIQKGFYPKVSGTYTAQMAHVINQARVQQRSLRITFLDLKNSFGEVHHNFVQEVLSYHHVHNLYTDFKTSIATHDFNTPFITIGRGVLQGDCLSPLLFNLCFTIFIQHIKSDEYRQCGFFNRRVVNGTLLSLWPIHWFQFADDAAVVSGQENENQLLSNRFTL